MDTTAVTSTNSHSGTRAFVEGYIGLMLVVMQMLLLMFLDRKPEFLAATRDNYQPPYKKQIFDPQMQGKLLTSLTFYDESSERSKNIATAAQLAKSHDLSVQIEGGTLKALPSALASRDQLINSGVPPSAVTIRLTAQHTVNALTLKVYR